MENYFTAEPFAFEKFHHIDHLKQFSHGEKVSVAILDSGISNELKMPVKESYNTFEKTRETEDGFGHGTAVASILKRVAPAVDIYDFKVLDKEGIGNQSTILDGLNLARAWDVDIAILSLGAQHLAPSPMLLDAIQKLARQTIILGAVGNEGKSSINFPASENELIGIGSIGYDGLRSEFSNYNTPEFVAIGDNVDTLDIYGYPIKKTGTSFSVPVFAGMLASSLSLKRQYQIECDLRQILIESCQYDKKKTDYGYGYPDGFKLIEVLRKYKN